MWRCHFTLKSILRQKKKNDANSNISPCKNILIFNKKKKKKPLKETKRKEKVLRTGQITVNKIARGPSFAWYFVETPKAPKGPLGKSLYLKQSRLAQHFLGSEDWVLKVLGEEGTGGSLISLKRVEERNRRFFDLFQKVSGKEPEVVGLGSKGLAERDRRFFGFWANSSSSERGTGEVLRLFSKCVGR
jgi:hypothetical protein